VAIAAGRRARGNALNNGVKPAHKKTHRFATVGFHD
jgi:hypothetical protein